MLLKLEEETETPSGMRHKRHRGEGACTRGRGRAPGPAPLNPKVKGTRQRKQAAHAGVDEWTKTAGISSRIQPHWCKYQLGPLTLF